MLKYLTSVSVAFCLLSSPLFAMDEENKRAKQPSKTLSVGVDSITTASSVSKSKPRLEALSDSLQKAALLHLTPKESCKAARTSKGIYRVILADDFWYHMGTQQMRVFRSLPLDQRAEYRTRLKGEFRLQFPIDGERTYRNLFVWYSSRSNPVAGKLKYPLNGYGPSIGFTLDLGVQIGDHGLVINQLSKDLDEGGDNLSCCNISIDTLKCIIEDHDYTFAKKAALLVGAHLSGTSRSEFLESYASKGKSKIALDARFQLALDKRKSGKLKEAEQEILELCNLGSLDAMVLHLRCLSGTNGYQDMFKKDDVAFKSAFKKYEQTYGSMYELYRGVRMPKPWGLF